MGPRPDEIVLAGSLPSVESNILKLDAEINQRESADPFIKPKNEANIFWYRDQNKQRTEYSILYLPGFSGSHYEAEPLHKELGQRYGANVYLARLYEHGMDKEEALLDFNGEKYLESAREALAIAQTIGEKVIIMGTSTGCTLSLFLASENPQIHGLINYSPNIDLYDPKAGLLTGPWGLQIARLVKGGNYHTWTAPEPWAYKYWNMKYRLESLIELKVLLDATMTEETFSKIRQPMYNGYWYKNEEEKDQTVSIERMKDMYSQIKTDESKKTFIAYPEAKTHVIACETRSGCYDKLRLDTFDFVENILGLPVISDF